MKSVAKDRNRFKDLMRETITQLCKNGLQFKSEFTIEAVIGITLDRGDDIFIVSIQEAVNMGDTVNKGDKVNRGDTVNMDVNESTEQDVHSETVPLNCGESGLVTGGGRNMTGGSKRPSSYRSCADFVLSCSRYKKTEGRKRDSGNNNCGRASEFEKRIKTDQNVHLFNDNGDAGNFDTSVPLPLRDSLDRHIESQADIQNGVVGDIRSVAADDSIQQQRLASAEEEVGNDGMRVGSECGRGGGECGRGTGETGMGGGEVWRGESDCERSADINIKAELILSGDEEGGDKRWRGDTEEARSPESSGRVQLDLKEIIDERKRRNRIYSAAYRRNSKLRHVVNNSMCTLNGLSRDTSVPLLPESIGASTAAAAGTLYGSTAAVAPDVSYDSTAAVDTFYGTLAAITARGSYTSSSVAATDGPYVCDECNQLMRSRRSLKSHKKIIHRGLYPYVCQQCKKGFSGLSNLRAHIAGVHEQRKEFACSQCGKEYGHKHSLNYHLLSAHNILVD